MLNYSNLARPRPGPDATGVLLVVWLTETPSDTPIAAAILHLPQM